MSPPSDSLPPVLILLPPSEGKAEPSAGDPLDLEALAFADQLGSRRKQLIRAFDRKLLEAPAAPATDIYTGVLFQRLGLPALSKAARKKVLIASMLWGVTRPDDRIPNYKLPPSTKLGKIGPLAKFWRPALAEALPDNEGELVVDMRSGAYAAAWKPKQAELLAVRAFTESDGERKAVSHMAKAVRGDVALALLRSKADPSTPDAVAELAEQAGFRVELAPGTLDVIVD